MKNNSPWIYSLERDRDLRELVGLVNTDVCVLGGGIAGVFTAYEILKNTEKKVVLIEGEKIAHGATGHNAGYVVADFEKPFKDIVAEYGLYVARRGLEEVENAWQDYFDSLDLLKIKKNEQIKSPVVFSDGLHFVESVNEMYLKYDKLKEDVYLLKDSNWKNLIAPNILSQIKILNKEDFSQKVTSRNLDTNIFQGIICERMCIGNSAVLTEKLLSYCLVKYRDRLSVYENSFINTIRLEATGNIFLDGAKGVCVSNNLILCTNGFEHFNILGPDNNQININFHKNVKGLIGYMIGTFLQNENTQNQAGRFYEKPFDFNSSIVNQGSYYYYTKRNFSVENNDGELLALGGAEVAIDETHAYDKNHEIDDAIFNELNNFQKENLGINTNPFFKWHGLMGYTESGIRTVGRDQKYENLFYNLGCNGIGILPSIAGAKRIAKLLNGNNLESSIFDPK